jgi:hypothetical protein
VSNSSGAIHRQGGIDPNSLLLHLADVGKLVDYADAADGTGVEYELIEHKPVMSAAAEARVAHVPPDHVAKTVVLHDGSAYVIAAIPASERLDLHKLRELLGATRQLRLANEMRSHGISRRSRLARCRRSGRWSRRPR